MFIPKYYKVNPMLISIESDHLVIDILGTEYKINHKSWDNIRNLKFWYNPERKIQKYPVAYCGELTNSAASLPTIINKSRCYPISTDYTDLRLENLTSTCKIENIEPGTIRVWTGNGNYFITDEKFSDYLIQFKWTQIQLKNGYPYVCRSIPGEGLELFHRYVAGATEPEQHVDHMNWNTLDNRESNLEIKSLYENISRWNPMKVERRFAR